MKSYQCVTVPSVVKVNPCEGSILGDKVTSHKKQCISYEEAKIRKEHELLVSSCLLHNCYIANSYASTYLIHI